MPIAQPLDYTDKDYDAVRARLRNLIRSVFPAWTDEAVANFGNILVDEFAFVADVLTKYQDNQARETRWTQATALKNVLAAVKLTGYQPTGQSAASVDEAFTLSAPAAADVVLPPGTLVSTLDITDPIAYQLLAQLTIPAGQTSATGACENSTSQSDTFASTGLPNQRFTLARTPYVDQSAAITAGDGTYTRVANFLKSGATDRHYVLAWDANLRATIYFGNSVNGAIPSGNITAAYKTGGGAAGRVEAGALQSLAGAFTDQHGAPVTISVSNALPSSGGADPQTVAQIQELAPLSVRVSDRTIAREDYEIVALGVPGVSRALFTTSNQDPGVPENRGILYVVPEGAGVPSQALLGAVAAALEARPKPPNMRVAIQAPAYLDCNVAVKAYRRAGKAPAELKAGVLAALAYYFADRIPATQPDGTATPARLVGTVNPLINFGFYLVGSDGAPTGSLAWSGIYDAINRAPAVRKVGAGALEMTVNGQRADVALAVRQFPRLGAVQVIDGDTGATL